MFAVLRTLAPAVLLLASLSGQTATGIVLAHVASEHAKSESHAGHRAADGHAVDHHAAEHHAADHHADAPGRHRDADHGSEHTHQIVPAPPAATARVACPSIDVQPCLAIVGTGRFDRPTPGALHHVALPELRAGPLEPQRHPILLL